MPTSQYSNRVEIVCRASIRNSAHMEKIKILVVEDEAPIQELLLFNLERKQYRVKIVDSGEEAMAQSQEFLPDLILLDIMLPGADGLEVCKQLKTNPQTADYSESKSLTMCCRAKSSCSVRLATR